MEKLLTRLFDYQKFENDPKLASVISDVEEKYSLRGKRRVLSEEDLELVSAAGILSKGSNKIQDFNP